jgi:hypothetical protein
VEQAVSFVNAVFFVANLFQFFSGFSSRLRVFVVDLFQSN